jgi:cell division inhibitor SepF
MGLKTKLKTFFLLDEEENEYMEEETVQNQPVQEPIRETIKRQQPVQPSQVPRQNVVSLQSIQKQSKVILV